MKKAVLPKPSSDDLDRLSGVLDKLERNILLSAGYNKLSGGFVTADMFNYDDDFFDVEVREGVVNDVENRVYTSQLKVCRKTFEVID